MEENFRVIIPSAKLVPEELQKLGKLPAIIYPINQKIAFDYIYDQYKSLHAKVDIICYENADKVERRLRKVIGNEIKVRKLPELHDLGYTILYAIENIDEPVVINFADTIVMDPIANISGDAFFYQEDYMSETWTYFDEENRIITHIYDKEAINEEIKKKLFVGVFKIINTHDFSECLRNAVQQKNKKMNSFYHALELYSKKHPMQAVLTDKLV